MRCAGVSRGGAAPPRGGPGRPAEARALVLWGSSHELYELWGFMEFVELWCFVVLGLHGPRARWPSC